MSALCKKCNYEFTQMALIGHISGELYTLYKAQKMAQINAIKSIKNDIDNLMIGFMNNQQLSCPQCKQYICWIPSNIVSNTPKKESSCEK